MLVDVKVLTVEVKGVGVLRTRVATAIEEIKHLLRRATEHQLSVSQDGNFVEVLIGQQTGLVCARVTMSLREIHFQAAS